MIYLYSGTPGSGKSLHMARDIMFKLRRGQNVIANFPINMELVKKGLFKKLKTGAIHIYRQFRTDSKIPC